MPANTHYAALDVHNLFEKSVKSQQKAKLVGSIRAHAFFKEERHAGFDDVLAEAGLQ